MKNILNVSFSLTAVLLTLALSVTSCSKKDNGVSGGNVELLSYGPAGVFHGDSVKIIGRNLDQVTELTLGGVTIPKSGFVLQRSDLIVVTVPNEAVRGKLILKSPGGDIESKTLIDFNVPVKISGMPATVRPGQVITLQGSFLNWITSILIPSDSLVTKFTSASLSQLVFTVPMTAQTGKWIFSISGTEPKQFSTESEVQITLPSITSAAPDPVRPEANLTIAGNDLDLVKEIKLPGVSEAISTFVSRSATQIVLKVPSQAKAGKITLVAYSGVSVISPFDMHILLPGITGFTPNPADRETNLTITGTDLDLVKGVKLNGASSIITSFVSQTETQLVVRIPIETVSGVVGLVASSGVVVESAATLRIAGDLPPLADFTLPIYTDALQSGFQNWSWAANDFNSSGKVRQGTRSIYATYGSGGYEGITFHNDAGVSTAGLTTLEFSVYGMPGTGGKLLNLVINGDWSHAYKSPPIVEGEWTRVIFQLTDIGSPNPLKEVILQSNGWSGSIYIDHVGLR
jgi:hypothetical protein